jgi:ubiquinone/menaquinone biosynthesis C-methylase UbiE|tara:strand:+ start:143 stop:898 length:756 start_codon:yes stop_codon:yes gene_type:complete
MELNIGNLQKNFKSTGAKDHPYFWINGAENFIPNMLECIKLTNYSPIVKKFDDFDNEHMESLKELFIKYGSDKFINPYYKYYSNVLSDKKDINILEIGMGTKDPTIASTMYFYKQDRDFDSTPGSSLRAFRDFVKGSSVYGADIDEKILFEEENIKTAKVDQLVKSEVDQLFPDTSFDFIVIDGLHHITSDVNSILSLIDRMNIGSKLIIEDITIFDNWKIVDFILSRIEGITTEFIVDNDSIVYIYVISK